MTEANKNLVYAYKKGYRIVNGIIFYMNKEVKGIPNRGKYYCFTIRIKKERKNIKVHRLVAYQKYGNRMFKKGIQVRHHDGNCQNNLPENIMIGTISQNNLDKPIEVRLRTAIAASNAIKVHNHNEIISLHKLGMSYNQIMKKLNISSKGTISFVIKKSIESKKTNQ